METKTIVSWIIVIVVVLGGIFFLAGSNETLDEETLDENGEVVSKVPALGNEDVNEMMVNEESPEGGDSVIPEADGGGVKPANVVEYTNNGFIPNEIEIARGESVKFVNNSTKDMWVGSAMHPTHSVYPEKTADDCLGSTFDQCERGAPDTSWEFTFNSVGEHGYHNHVRSSHWGKVIVQ